MFNISFKVSDSRLTSVLAQLHPFVPAVTVEHITSETQPAASTASSIAVEGLPTRVVKVRRHRRAYHRQGKDGGPTEQQKAFTLLQQLYGVPPFKIGDFLARCGQAGMSKPTAYRAIRVAIQAGLLKRLQAGTYQRTAISFGTDLKQRSA